MRLLNKTPALLYRHTNDGFWNEKGEWAEGSLTSTPIRCSFQPEARGGIYQTVLPEGITQKDCRTIYTKSEILEASEYDQINADYLEILGKEYEVFKVKEYFSASGKLSHYEALLIRRDKLNAIS